jgi:hypothetical protein
MPSTWATPVPGVTAWRWPWPFVKCPSDVSPGYSDLDVAPGPVADGFEVKHGEIYVNNWGQLGINMLHASCSGSSPGRFTRF